MRSEQDGRPLRILHLHSSFDLGGKEARAVRLMNAWGQRATHTVLSGVSGALSARNAIAPGIVADFPDDAPSLAGLPSLGRWRDLANYMRGFDLILSYNWGAMDGVGAHWLASRVGAMPPLIHHEDGFGEDEAVKLKTKRNLFRRMFLRSAHALIVPSERLQHIAERHWGIHAPRLRVIPNGIPVERYQLPPAPDAVPGFTRTPGQLVVGTLAGLREVKNLSMMVRAVAACRDRLNLLIVGEGPDRARIVAQAAASGLVALHLAGFLSEPWRFVGLFDIFALSSDSEQFPISLVEAMAAGRPVVSTDVGDVRSMVAEENRPFVVPVGDEAAFAGALATLAQDPELRHRLGEANRARALRDYDEGAMISAYARLYGEALARPSVLL